MTLPAFALMPLSRLREPFDHPDWLFELKHDGFRSLAYVEAGTCTLVSRRRNPYKSFDRLKATLAGLRAKEAVLDGEIVCLDAEGKSQFNELLYRRGEPAFYAFDLLWLNGRDLRPLPLLARKEKLHRLLDKSRLDRVLYAHHVEEHGIALFAQVCAQDLEGIVAKKKDQPYSTRAKWIKIKNPNYSQTRGRRERFDAFKGRRKVSQSS